jgi:hypothetical protein
MVTAGANIATSIMAMEAGITDAAAMRPSMVIMPTATMIATADLTAAKCIMKKCVADLTAAKCIMKKCMADHTMMHRIMTRHIMMRRTMTRRTMTSTTSNL